MSEEKNQREKKKEEEKKKLTEKVKEKETGFGRKGSSSSGARGFALRSYYHNLQCGRCRGGDRETERVGSVAHVDLLCA